MAKILVIDRMCSKCKSAKPADEFGKGSATQCLACRRLASRKWYNNGGREKKRAQEARWKLENPEKAKTQSRNGQLKYWYGITLAEYEVLLLAQQGRCAICNAVTPMVGKFQNLHVDHDHVTNQVRGLLCKPCNVSLGNMKDSPELLRKAADYLERGGYYSHPIL